MGLPIQEGRYAADVRIGILTGGGDCPGLNAVIRAVTRLRSTAATRWSASCTAGAE